MPSRSGAIHVLTFGTPSTLIRQEEHLPIPQKKPRGLSYFKLVLSFLTPAACKADAMVSPSSPEIFFLLKKKGIFFRSLKSIIGWFLILRIAPHPLNIESFFKTNGVFMQFERLL